MAKVNVEFDTVEKTISVSINGQSIDDASEVVFHKDYEDEWCCSVLTMSHDEENDLRSYTRLSANEKGDFVGTPQVHLDIQKYITG